MVLFVYLFNNFNYGCPKYTGNVRTSKTYQGSNLGYLCVFNFFRHYDTFFGRRIKIALAFVSARCIWVFETVSERYKHPLGVSKLFCESFSKNIPSIFFKLRRLMPCPLFIILIRFRLLYRTCGSGLKRHQNWCERLTLNGSPSDVMFPIR